ncbi:hypothetical protein ACFPVT_10705 [Corynebacterium choanae]|uniref:hypothetical protein n=1 Tax=Corynebacterium choanae TaxID=1862358 RepID=UPI000F508F18|nr:hypothetical protein [Corynebacterium choanae]
MADAPLSRGATTAAILLDRPSCCPVITSYPERRIGMALSPARFKEVRRYAGFPPAVDGSFRNLPSRALHLEAV